MEKLILIDGNHLIYRAFWAITPLHADDGTPTNAVYGFFSTIMNLLINFKPNYLIVTFDSKEKSFRHEKDDQYKAHREKAPADLIVQIPIIQDLLRKCKILIYAVPGLEADDILATLATQASQKGILTQILTNDLDIFQLISEKIHILQPQRGAPNNMQAIDRTKFIEIYKITPEQVADFKGLVGDPSDNLKGVTGIGKVTALKLLNEYQTLINLYQHLDALKSVKLKEKLINDQKNAFHAYEMASLRKEADLQLELTSSRVENINFNQVLPDFKQLDFYVLVKRINKYLGQEGDSEMEKMIQEVFAGGEKKEQLSLF
jgi:DNA polymerase-1